MEIKEILKKTTDSRYAGYEVNSISSSTLTPQNLELYRKLKRLPHKITNFFHRDKIKAVFKSNCFKDPIDEFYLILSTDNTIFFVDY